MADNLILKSLARVTDTDPDDAPYGGFEAIASTPERDRDGDVISQKDWSPLPEKVTIDVDHTMNVRGTIGSAHPFFDDEGNLRISARFASTPLAQEVRALMTEGHIDSVSVAFMKSTGLKSADGEKETSLELLNVGVVAIPSNRNAKVLTSKSLEIADIELGLKSDDNRSAALKHVQAIHDHSSMLGATCNGHSDEAGDDEHKELAADVETKTVSDKPWSDFSAADYTIEQWRSACLIGPSQLSDNKSDYKLPVREPSGVVNRNGVHAAASVLAGGRGGVDASAEDKANAAKALVSLYKNQLHEDPPDSLLTAAGEKALDADVITKDADTESDNDPGKLAQACDAALDEAIDLISQVDASALPAEVQQAIALIQAADTAIDELLDVLNVSDPDEDATDEKSSDTAEEKAVSDDDLSAAVYSRALNFVFECEALSLSNESDTE